MKPNFIEVTKQTLERGYLMSLGVVDADGPWVADVIYVFDEDLNIYWMSRTTRRHSVAIETFESHVAGTITVSQDPSDTDEGLQLSGVAERVENPSKELLVQWMKKKKKLTLLAPLVRLVLDDHVWYKLTPDRIELISRKHFRDRQRVI